MDGFVGDGGDAKCGADGKGGIGTINGDGKLGYCGKQGVVGGVEGDGVKVASQS